MTSAEVKLNRRERAERAAIASAQAGASRSEMFRWFKQQNAQARRRHRSFKNDSK